MSVNRTEPETTDSAPQKATPVSGLKKLSSAAAPSGPPIDVTEAAARQIEVFQGEHAEFEGKTFRIKVDGGGCAGFRYAFVFDEPLDGDVRMTFHGVDVNVDPFTLQYLKGSQVDYISDLMASGFTVKNPNSTSTCGCGHSFGV